jgi:hypothetical protein
MYVGFRGVRLTLRKESIHLPTPSIPEFQKKKKEMLYM